MQQVLFRIPIRIPDWTPDGIPIYGFGLMLFIAFVACTVLASSLAVREGIRKEILQDLGIWLFVGGIIGARITFLIDKHESIWQFFRIWDGGLVFYGSAIGGLAAYVFAYFYLIRKNHVSTLRLADIIAPCIAVGLCIGRLGCLLNGCCFGNVVCPDCYQPQIQFPFSSPPRYDLTYSGYQTAAGFTMAESGPDSRTVGAVDPASAAAVGGLKPGDIIIKAIAVPTRSELDEQHIEHVGQLYDFLTQHWPRGKNQLTLQVKRGNEELTIGPFAPATLGLHPTQLYESISMALAFFLLMAYLPFRKHPGELMAIIMFCYGLHRYFNEMLRIDQRPLGFEKYISLFLIVAGIVFWGWLRIMPTKRIQVTSNKQGDAHVQIAR
jgi:prolipoprotein diacylglyceryltransferase